MCHLLKREDLLLFFFVIHDSRRRVFGFGFGNKQFEDVSLGSGKLCWAFLKMFLHFLNWTMNLENNQQINSVSVVALCAVTHQITQSKQTQHLFDFIVMALFLQPLKLFHQTNFKNHILKKMS